MAGIKSSRRIFTRLIYVKNVENVLLLYVHPGKLTWNLRITHVKRKNIFQTFIFGFHVKFRGCTPTSYQLLVCNPPSSKVALQPSWVPLEGSLERLGTDMKRRSIDFSLIVPERPFKEKEMELDVSSAKHVCFYLIFGHKRNTMQLYPRLENKTKKTH